MKRVSIALLLGFVMVVIIMIASFLIVVINLLMRGYDFNVIISRISLHQIFGALKGAFVGGVAIFILSLIGTPRLRRPH